MSFLIKITYDCWMLLQVRRRLQRHSTNSPRSQNLASVGHKSNLVTSLITFSHCPVFLQFLWVVRRQESEFFSEVAWPFSMGYFVFSERHLLLKVQSCWWIAYHRNCDKRSCFLHKGQLWILGLSILFWNQCNQNDTLLLSSTSFLTFGDRWQVKWNFLVL